MLYTDEPIYEPDKEIEVQLQEGFLKNWNRQRAKQPRRHRKYIRSLYQNIRTGKLLARNPRQLRLRLA